MKITKCSTVAAKLCQAAGAIVWSFREVELNVFVRLLSFLCRTWEGRFLSLPDQSRAELNRTEQRGAEQSRAEQNRTEGSRTEQSRAEQSRAEQNRTEQVRSKKNQRRNEEKRRKLLADKSRELEAETKTGDPKP